tara:strand:+ start:481 stop:1872 length:1392 start_codon:yes stop_codon:yes gene_type:complete
MSANKSIIEEALLEAKQIEEAVKTNTKEILAKTMMPEIEEMVKESLTEDDLTETGEEQVTEDEESVTVDAQIDDEESDYEGDDEDDEEEVAIIAVSDEDDDEEGEEASAEIEMGGEVEIPSIVDLTSSSDDEVIKVFKELSDDDEVEVVGDVVKIKATEPTEYRVEVPSADIEEADTMEEESYIGEDEAIYEIELSEDDLNEIESAIDEGGDLEDDQSKTRSDYKNYKGTDKGYKGKTGSSHGDQGEPDDYVNEKDGDEAGDQSKTKGRDYKKYKGTDKGYKGKTGSSHGDQGDPKDYENEGEDEIEEASRTHGMGSKKGRGLRKAISNNRNLEFNEGVEAELIELKAKNNEYKEALKVFRNKLNEIAVFNSNLAYATKLFMEHSTTKTEKMDILKRFDNVSTLKESKSLFRSIEGEMGTKAPVTESIEKTIKAPKAGALIKEDTAYVDPQVTRMKFLMDKLG